MTNQKAINKEIKKHLGDTKPLRIFKKWLDQAFKSSEKKEDSWFMVLSTCYKNQVSSRVVLLKEIQGEEIVFYTNYLSEKGLQISKNPQVAVNFYWPHLKKQIRLKGKVVKTSRKKSLSYWKSRHRQSQISQNISRQSQKLSSRKELLDLKDQMEKKERSIPCPLHWGGYRIKIQKIEFWKDDKHRLHDRFLFEKKGGVWKVQRLFP
ncbi:MAG: pyridoxamine 5'-phosphate oxidase [Bdellovibrionales bacterium]|nr:pyridoxamine 5'-phosphate oxidase [Bdellovibrionales bacterium]